MVKNPYFMFKILYCFSIFAITSVATQAVPESLKDLSKTFIVIINAYNKFTDKEIRITNNNIFLLEKIQTIFTYNSYNIDNTEDTVSYLDVEIHLYFNLKLMNEQSSLRGKKQKIPTITIKRNTLSYTMRFDKITFLKKQDNSFDYYKDMNPIYQHFNFGELLEFAQISNIIGQYGEKKLYNDFLNMWYDLLEEIVAFFPICDAYSNYRRVAIYLFNSGYFSIISTEEPSLTKIRFTSLKYKAIQRVNPFSRKLIFFEMGIEFDKGQTTTIYYDEITFTQGDIIFGILYPTTHYNLKEVVEVLFMKAFLEVKGK